MTFITGAKPRRMVVCMNGYIMSIQAGAGYSCTPKRTNAYAYTELECSLEEPPSPGPAWDAVQPFKTSSYGIYTYVPIGLVFDLIQENGGMRSGDMPPSLECYDEYRKMYPDHPAPYREELYPYQSDPMYEHDCGMCHYEGRVLVMDGGHRDGTMCDAYVCHHPHRINTGSIIARYGSEGSHYWSVPFDVAKRLVKEYMENPTADPPASRFYIEVLRRARMLESWADDCRIREVEGPDDHRE